MYSLQGEEMSPSDTPCIGTFWYHSHLSTQYCDGLRGPMVVYDPSDPNASLYDVDDGEFLSVFLHVRSA